MRWKVLSKIEDKKGQKRTEVIRKCLLVNRGLKTKKQQQEFLNPKNPYKLTLKEVGIAAAEMKKAISRIKKAIKNKEKIIVYGDYDADGICSTAIVWETLRDIGGQAMPFIPTREEGHGLKVDKIDQLADEGVKLIITVDQGIVHSKQIARARKLGIDVIVTDHHVLGKKKPNAVAIIHTTQLAGVGVAWFLCRELVNIGLDLVTLGTITDMVPLLEANRSLVKYGFKELRATKRIGLKSLYQVAGLDETKIGSYEIGFVIGPRINASGRIKDPMEPLRLLCLRRDKARAEKIAAGLSQSNRERQRLTAETVIHARKLWLEQTSQGNLIFVQDQSYHQGVIGLVAQKLSEEFYRPVVVISQGEEESRASGRSIKEFNLIEAIRACADLLGSHGGHALAAGFTVETIKIDLVKTRLQELAEKSLGGKELAPVLKIDAEIELSDLNFAFYHQLEKLEPFGMDNHQPVFVSKQVKVVNARLVGKGKQHLSLGIESSTGIKLKAIGFGMADFYPQLSSEEPIDIAFNLFVNEWNGQKNLELKLKDIKLNDETKI